MAKSNMKARESRRIELSAKAYEKRDLLKKEIILALSLREKMGLAGKLTSMPRDGSKSRIRNRCQLCGRARGVYSKFKLCRCCLRKVAMLGEVPGLVKASW